MDIYYEKENARIRLQGIVKSCFEKAPKGVHFSEYGEVRILVISYGKDVLDDTTITSIARPKIMKLTKPALMDDGSPGLEEVVLRLQGIICNQSLPPVTKQTRIENRQRRYIRQTVELTSLGSPYFTDTLHKIHDINEQFSRNLPPNAMETWNSQQFEGHPSLIASNRYFTNRHDQSHHPHVPLGANVDPDGVLQQAMGDEFVHLHENQVEYFEAVKIGGVINKHKKINPIKFRIGDIVEAQISFVTYQLRGNKYKLIVVLRAITLLDSQNVMDAIIARSRQQVLDSATSVLVVKRKVGYSDDDMDEEGQSSAKVQRMINSSQDKGRNMQIDN
ncbi:hypothetical protein JOM56_013182 [Amanita muscaria]